MFYRYASPRDMASGSPGQASRTILQSRRASARSLRSPASTARMRRVMISFWLPSMPEIHRPEPGIDYSVPGTRQSDKYKLPVLRLTSNAPYLLPSPPENRSRVGKGRAAGSIELRVSPSPSKIPYGGFSPVRLQMDRQWRPSTTSQGLSAVHIRPTTPSYTPPQLQLPGIRDPRRDYPF